MKITVKSKIKEEVPITGSKIKITNEMQEIEATDYEVEKIKKWLKNPSIIRRVKKGDFSIIFDEKRKDDKKQNKENE